MNEPSLFTKIIRGEIPSYKIYEDEYTFAFLDIHPIQPGHTLVVPKSQVDKLYDLSDEDYMAVMATVKKIMRHVTEVLGVRRACMKAEGFDVPHAHVHVIPCNQTSDFFSHVSDDDDVDHEALATMAERLKY